MKFFSSFKAAFLAQLCITILCGIAYPICMWGIGHLFFHRSAEGSLYSYKNGEVLGSVLIAQSFTSPQYFHPRPSNAGRGYDATSSSASNLGPTSKKLIEILRQRAVDYRTENQLPPDSIIPADAITASGSGLDPHISIENARLQVPRIASARSLSLAKLEQAIKLWTEKPFLGIFGTERVNVLSLNLALDQLNNQ